MVNNGQRADLANAHWHQGSDLFSISNLTGYRWFSDVLWKQCHYNNIIIKLMRCNFCHAQKMQTGMH